MPQLKKLNTFWTEICVDAQDTDPFMMLLSLLQLMHQTASGYIHILHRQIFRPFRPPTLLQGPITYHVHTFSGIFAITG